jgi:hypothetical protein
VILDDDYIAMAEGGEDEDEEEEEDEDEDEEDDDEDEEDEDLSLVNLSTLKLDNPPSARPHLLSRPARVEDLSPRLDVALGPGGRGRVVREGVVSPVAHNDPSGRVIQTFLLSVARANGRVKKVSTGICCELTGSTVMSTSTRPLGSLCATGLTTPSRTTLDVSGLKVRNVVSEHKVLVGRSLEDPVDWGQPGRL